MPQDVWITRLETDRLEQRSLIAFLEREEGDQAINGVEEPELTLSKGKQINLRRDPKRGFQDIARCLEFRAVNTNLFVSSSTV